MITQTSSEMLVETHAFCGHLIDVTIAASPNNQYQTFTLDSFFAFQIILDGILCFLNRYFNKSLRKGTKTSDYPQSLRRNLL